MMNTQELIETLKTHSKSDPVVNAVMTVFGTRERARDRVTMQALTQRMKEEGFVYNDADYAKVLQLLAKLGLGRLDTDGAGRVRALRDVKVKLQSIGMAAAQGGLIEPWRPRNKFQQIPIVEAAPARKPEAKVGVAAPRVEEKVIKERVQPRPAPGVWEVLCVPLDGGGTYKTYIPKALTEADAKRIGLALAGMVKKA